MGLRKSRTDHLHPSAIAHITLWHPSACVYRTIQTNGITSAVEDWKIPGHPVYRVEAMNLPPLEAADTTPRAVALLEAERPF